MELPTHHPWRARLSDEVHARPPEALSAPMRLSYLALLSDPAQGERERRGIARLAEDMGAESPPAAANHYRADLGTFGIVWERHTEFSTYTFSATGGGDDPFATPAVALVPGEWIAALPGEVIAASHLALVPGDEPAPDCEAVAARLFGGNTPIGSAIADGAATAITDFRIHDDGFGRYWVANRGMSPRQAGRMVQRLLEIDAYRIMALLALPVAQELVPFLTTSERDLARITSALASSREIDEPELLDHLTRLAAEIESRQADNHYRFAAAIAYHELVQRRIDELREQRIQGLQTFRQFTDRRMVPAMKTCRAVAERQDSVSRRVARSTQLLSTRVEIARQEQNQAVLASMDRRARLQLRLQETVEGLSVAAITYYVVGLVGYVAKGLKSAGLAVDPAPVMAISIPVVAVIAALGIRHIRKSVSRMAG